MCSRFENEISRRVYSRLFGLPSSEYPRTCPVYVPSLSGRCWFTCRGSETVANLLVPVRFVYRTRRRAQCAVRLMCFRKTTVRFEDVWSTKKQINRVKTDRITIWIHTVYTNRQKNNNGPPVRAPRYYWLYAISARSRCIILFKYTMTKEKSLKQNRPISLFKK